MMLPKVCSAAVNGIHASDYFLYLLPSGPKGFLLSELRTIQDPYRCVFENPAWLRQEELFSFWERQSFCALAVLSRTSRIQSDSFLVAFAAGVLISCFSVSQRGQMILARLASPLGEANWLRATWANLEFTRRWHTWILRLRLAVGKRKTGQAARAKTPFCR